jgi:hypothetical protein
LARDRLTSQRWHLSHRFDVRALPLADRHYNRRKVGSPQFCPPGSCLVLLTEDATALWVTSAPKGEYVRHAWPGAWVNSLFRNEGPILSSELIREAVAATCAFYGAPPKQGMVTFVDPREDATEARPRALLPEGRLFGRWRNGEGWPRGVADRPWRHADGTRGVAHDQGRDGRLMCRPDYPQSKEIK